MVFDCHTHIYGPGHVSETNIAFGQKAWGEQYNPVFLPEDHWEKVKDIDGAIVLAFDAPATGTEVPNEYVAEYVKKHPGRLFGFASVDPNNPQAPNMLDDAITNLKLSGLKIAPIYQNFYPDDKKHFPLYAKANELDIPILFHQGTSFVAEGYLDASRPAALDPIAREYPDLKMVIAHMGHPWIGECIAVVRKNPNMYMDLSALGGRPWQFYNAIVLAMEYRVTHKILLGSDLPFFTTEQTIDSLWKINDVVKGTGMPKVSDQIIEEIIHRNTVELLGLIK